MPVIKVEIALAFVAYLEALEKDIWNEYAKGSSVTQKAWEKKFPGLEYHTASGDVVRQWSIRAALAKFEMLADNEPPAFILNGKAVTKFTKHDNGYTTVFIKRGRNDYVIASWWPELNDHWQWGHYERFETEAESVYAETCARNAKRGNATP